MNKNIMTDLGENYQYIQTIANNTIELKKIEFAESTSSILGKSILFVLIGSLSVIALLILFIALGVLVYNYTGSILLSLATIFSVCIILSIAIYLLRKTMIYNPITKAIYSIILNITD